MSRKLVWIEQERFQGFGCSECAWRFKSSSAPTGKSLDEMMRNFELQRDKEFTSHGCAEQPTLKRLKRETESGRATLSSAVAEGRSGSRGMSPAALKRIVVAQKARWAKWRKAQKNV
jgi:hypothetical protein